MRSLSSSKKMLSSLVWLAQQMRAPSQSILYLEQLQADWLPSGWSQQVYSWLGVGLPDILIGSLLSVVVFLVVFDYTATFELLSSFLLGGVVAGLLGSMPAAHAALTLPRRSHHFFSLLAWAAFLRLSVGLFMALVSNSSRSADVSPSLTGMSFGIGTVLLTLLLARRPPSSPQAMSQPGSGIGTRRGFWRQLLSNEALRQGLLVGGLFGLSDGLSLGLSVGLSAGLSAGLTTVAFI
jgi:hypothetical protein